MKIYSIFVPQYYSKYTAKSQQIKYQQFITMKLDKKSLKILHKSLPPGSASIIRDRLMLKGNPSFSLKYIYQVLNPDDHHYNILIINETIIYLQELKEQNKKTRELIEALK
jgi:hypothetical protein